MHCKKRREKNLYQSMIISFFFFFHSMTKTGKGFYDSGESFVFAMPQFFVIRDRYCFKNIHYWCVQVDDIKTIIHNSRMAIVERLKFIFHFYKNSSIRISKNNRRIVRAVIFFVARNRRFISQRNVTAPLARLE